MAVVSMVSQLAQANCEESKWPVYAGGETGSEFTRCFTHDEQNGLLIVGGVTQSEDFGPASNDHGFLYALDYEGNWKWSSFIYNSSWALASVDGCMMSSDGSRLVLQGMSNSLPVVVTVDTADGSVTNFYELGSVEDSDSSPWYETYGAVFLDEKDWATEEPFFYTAYKKDDVVHWMRVNIADETNP